MSRSCGSKPQRLKLSCSLSRVRISAMVSISLLLPDHVHTLVMMIDALGCVLYTLPDTPSIFFWHYFDFSWKLMKSTIDLCAISYHISVLQSHCKYSAADDMDGRWIVPHLYNYSCAKSYKLHCFRSLRRVIGNPFGKVTNCRGDPGHVVGF